jgi:hypothetical protein
MKLIKVYAKIKKGVGEKSYPEKLIYTTKI